MTIEATGKRRLAAALLALSAALSAWGGIEAVRAARATADAPPLPGRSAAWYATYGGRAFAAGRADLALAAARLEALADPRSAAAQERLAHAATLAAGRPTREALAALDVAYTLQPFPAPERAVWRVAFAEAHWPAVPDPLAARTLDQVRVLGESGVRWEERAAWCRASPVEALARTACATVPGVRRSADA